MEQSHVPPLLQSTVQTDDQSQTLPIVQIQTALLDMMQDAVLIYDTNYRIQTWNRRAEAFYGWSAQEVVGKRARILLKTQIMHADRDEKQWLLERKGSWTAELLNLTRMGKEVIVDCHATMLQDAVSNAILILETHHDITMQKQMQQGLIRDQELKRENERIANILENIADGYVLLDKEWRCIYANRRSEEITGLDSRAYLGKVIWEAMPELLGTNAERLMRQAMATQLVTDFENFFELTQQWFYVHLVPSPEYLTIYYRDISVLKQMQAVTQERMELFRRLFDTNVVGFTTSNLQGDILDANDAFLSIVGYSREDLKAGRINYKTLTPPEYAQMDEQATAEMHSKGVYPPFEKEYYHKQGHRVPILLLGAYIDHSEHDVDVIIDMTAKKEYEKQKELLFGIISHELRTPLTAINGSIQLAQRRLKSFLQNSDLPPETHNTMKKVMQLLEQSLRQTRVQNRMINDLVDASRLAVNKLELELAPTDLINLVHEIVEDMRSTDTSHPISLSLPEQIPLIMQVDGTRISQVLANYLTNAFKYSPPEMPIHVEVTIEEKEVYVWVHDRGPGLSEEAQERIWTSFYRAKGTKDLSGKGVNLGLGLHLCKTLIERHHGHVGVESKPDEGSSFWFSLPLS